MSDTQSQPSRSILVAWTLLAVLTVPWALLLLTAVIVNPGLLIAADTRVWVLVSLIVLVPAAAGSTASAVCCWTQRRGRQPSWTLVWIKARAFRSLVGTAAIAAFVTASERGDWRLGPGGLLLAALYFALGHARRPISD